jgi:tetratricopeptide (TPR) repeat protein
MTYKTRISWKGLARKMGLGFGVAAILALCVAWPVEGGQPRILQRVSSYSGEDVSVIDIVLSGDAIHRVIPLDEREMLVAFRDTELAEDVYGSETVVGDPLVERIENAQNPSHVACVVVRTVKRFSEIEYRITERDGGFRIELRAKDQRPDETGAESSKTVLTEEVTEDKQDSEGDPASRDLGAQTAESRIAARLLEEGRSHFEKAQWEKAVSVLEELVSWHPESDLVEPAFFLLAKSFQRSVGERAAERISEVVERFQIAVSRYPASPFVPDALVSMGNCHFHGEQYHEAMNYYDRVLAEYKENPAAAEAMFQKGRILALTEKPLRALKYFETLEEHFPKSEFFVKAKLEMAKTLFDIKSFKRSLKLVQEIRSSVPDQVHTDPDILLYAGYNYYELGQLREAREALSTALNLFPEVEAKDLILTRIADSYREDGIEDKASKLYDLVARSYPGSEGSLISLLRVAEGVEKAAMSAPVAEKEQLSVDASKKVNEIYGQIAKSSPDSPLAQVAMLKLATFEKKSGRYEVCIDTLKDLLAKKPDEKLAQEVHAVLQEAMVKLALQKQEQKDDEGSVETLRQLLGEYPNTELNDEMKSALEQSLHAVFQARAQGGKTEGLINYYDAVKKDIPFDAVPNLLLEVGEAYRNLHLHSHALGVFLKAKRALEPKELPAKALLALGESAFEERRYEEAEASLRAFVEKYATDKEVSSAYQRLGNTYLKMKQFDQAAEAFKMSLENGGDDKNRAVVFSAMAEAALGQGDYGKAEMALASAVSLLEREEGVSTGDLSIAYSRLGEVRSRLGQKGRAVEALENALKFVPAGTNSYELQYRLAQCYHGIEAPEKAEALLNKIAASGDPFWSKLARAQIDEINIGQSAAKLGFEAKRS